jgi:hypothetical protein
MKTIAFLPVVGCIFFGGSAVYGLSCPDLTSVVINDTIKIGQVIEEWTVLGMEGEWTEKPEKLYAYDAWILTKTQHFPNHKLQCNFVNENKHNKITFGKVESDPLKYRFMGPNYLKYDNETDTVGWKCTPWAAKIHNKFPFDCDVVLGIEGKVP